LGFFSLTISKVITSEVLSLPYPALHTYRLAHWPENTSAQWYKGNSISQWIFGKLLNQQKQFKKTKQNKKPLHLF
jgi:hypothetical protein